jgi:hypothetical protein
LVARAIAKRARTVRVIEAPDPYKDVRAWVAAGATRVDVENIIEGGVIQ